LLSRLDELTDEEVESLLQGRITTGASCSMNNPSDLATLPTPKSRRRLLKEFLERKVERSRSFPLSFAQQRLWLLDQLNPGNPAFNLSAALRLTGQLDLSAVERSLYEIVRRHETLRTTFAEEDGQPVQRIAAYSTLPIPVVNLSQLSAAERESETRRLAAENALAPFDLTAGPLVRAKLLRLGEREHVILFAIHHIVADGWSLALLTRELGVLYEAFRRGQPSPLAELPIQYVDYADWQGKWLQGKRSTQQLQYWMKQLDALPVLELPTDQPRPAVQTHRGAACELLLPQPLWERLKTLNAKEGVTPFMSLLAVFKTLLSRYTGEQDIVVGTPIKGRNRIEVEGLIGFFLNTLVLRTSLSGNPTYRELLSRVRRVAVEAFANQDLPFERLVEHLQPNRDLSRTPLFQVFFNMLDVGSQRLRLPDLVLEPLPDPVPPALFDMTLYAQPVGQEMNLRLVYNADLFRRDRMSEMLDQFRFLVEQITDNPDATIVSYSLARETDQRLPNPALPLDEPRYDPVTDLFAACARAAPDSLAVCQGDQACSYGDLRQRAETLARTLVAAGVHPGDVVALTGTKSPGLIAAMLGTLSSGGVLLPIDDRLPVERKQLMLREAGAGRLIFVSARSPENEWFQQDAKLAVLTVDPDNMRCDRQLPLADAAEPPLPVLEPDNAAYIFFTSGSTSTPKGLLGCHKGLSHFVRWQAETFDIGAQDRVAQLMGISFDAMLRDVFLPLTRGATLCLPEAEDPQDYVPVDVLRWMQAERITVLHTVPALAQTWLASVSEEIALPDLRWTFFSGEPLTASLLDRWRRVTGGSGQVVNMYGPTETTMVKCFYIVPEEIDWSTAPAGHAMPQTQALVMAGDYRLCGVGELGEIVLRTPFRTLGYINAPQEQERRFVPNPYRQDPMDLLYRTGDRGRYRPDGQLEVLGREDDQVKIHGVRVEPSEITATLAQHPQVESCYVTAWSDAAGQKYLAAYIVGTEPGQEDLAALRAYLQQKLPAALVPTAYVPLPALPLTSSGKVDRRALPEPETTAAASRPPYVAPRTPTEQLVAAICSDVLNTDPVGIHDNFFHLGGHSLLAVQLISRLRRTFDVELPLRALFEQPTVAGLAASLDRGRGEGRADSVPPMERVDRTGNLPLSFAQERLWFLDQWEPESPYYNIPMAVRIRGDLDVQLLRQTLAEITRRHESLRTMFAAVDGKPTQLISDEVDLSLPIVDLSELDEDRRESEATRMVRDEVQQPFDLARGPLFRCRLLRLSAGNHVLTFTIHHIVSDAWSIGVMIREIAALYEAFSADRPSPLESLPIQYVDYAAWQRRWLQGDVLQEQLQYWERCLEGMPTLELPTDRPRPPMQTFRGATLPFTWSRELLDGLTSLSRRRETTLFMTLLAGFQVLLARYSGQQDVGVGTPIAGRSREELEGLIGFFVNTLVLRTRLEDDPTVAELLTRVRETVVGAFAHQDIPFEMLVQRLQPQRDTSRSPLFQVMLVSLDMPGAEVEAAGLTVTPLETTTKTSKFDLTVYYEETAEGIRGRVEYNTDLFDLTTIERMTENFRQLLEAVVDDPTQRVSKLSLLSEQERRRLLIDWNATDLSYPRQECVHELFAERAAAQPDAIAVVFGDNRLTYRQLDEQSNQLAQHLRSLGVGPDVLVGIYTQRSMKMAVGLLGILKAGGAYVPLDPSFPHQRIEWMLEDSQAPVLLVQDSLLERLSEYPGKVVRLDADWDTIARQPAQRLETVARAEHLAYVIFTSGSTGRPKGVMIPHRALVNFLCSMQREPGLEPSDVLLSVTTFSFDIFGLELYLPLVVGATVVVADDETASDAALLQQELERCEATVLQATPATWRMLLQAHWPGRPGLRMLVGGEALDAQLARELLERGDTLWNLYGPTETTIWSTAVRIPRDFAKISIGRPIGNTQIYILDERMEPVPVGVRGDLYIGGDGLARGYLNRPELTDEKFITAPFDSLAGARLYKTGDQARWLANGEIDFLGRVDHQVKVRGFRIELGEIESVLSQHEAVHQAVVVARPDAMGEQRLVAYVVFVDGQRASVESLREALGSRLPDYMIPSVFETLNAFPLTPNGKVDRKALPEPSSARPELEKQYVAPSTPTEQELVEIWRELLRLDQVGVHDNFFHHRRALSC
jgi:amino acid adenylation domain-containing protein